MLPKQHNYRQGVTSGPAFLLGSSNSPVNNLQDVSCAALETSGRRGLFGRGQTWLHVVGRALVAHGPNLNCASAVGLWPVAQVHHLMSACHKPFPPAPSQHFIKQLLGCFMRALRP